MTDFIVTCGCAEGFLCSFLFSFFSFPSAVSSPFIRGQIEIDLCQTARNRAITLRKSKAKMPKGLHEPALGSSVVLGCLGPVSTCPSVSGVRFLAGPTRPEDSFRSPCAVPSRGSVLVSGYF